jgi:hypothetical protein
VARLPLYNRWQGITDVVARLCCGALAAPWASACGCSPGPAWHSRLWVPRRITRCNGSHALLACWQGLTLRRGGRCVGVCVPPRRRACAFVLLLERARVWARAPFGCQGTCGLLRHTACAYSCRLLSLQLRPPGRIYGSSGLGCCRWGASGAPSNAAAAHFSARRVVRERALMCLTASGASANARRAGTQGSRARERALMC